jgi:hypothetical protein
MAFSLRQQGAFSFLVAGFSPGGAKNRQHKDSSYDSAESQKTLTA